MFFMPTGTCVCLDVRNQEKFLLLKFLLQLHTWLFCMWSYACLLYSQLSLSRLRLSRITAYLEEKIWSLF